MPKFCLGRFTDEAAVVVRINTESFLAEPTANLRNWTTAAIM